MALGDNLPARIASSTGTTYYVDGATGSDSDDGLSEANAWATLQKAIDTINFGTVSGGAKVLVKNHGGAGYKGNIASGTDGGTMQFGDLTSGGRTAPDATHVATFEPFPGHTPVILPPDEDAAGDERNCVNFNHSNAKYIRIGPGFEFTGDGVARPGDAPAFTVGGGANHLEIIGNHIHDVTADDNGTSAKAQGIYLDEASDSVHILLNEIHDIGNDATADPNLEHGIYCQGTNHVIVGNILRDNRNGFGMQLFGDTIHSAPGHIIAHNTYANNKMSGCVVDGSDYTGIEIHNEIYYDNDQNGLVVQNSAVVNSSQSIANSNGSAQFTTSGGGTLNQTNNLTSDPLFRDYTGRDLRLTATSPALDYADDTWSMAEDLRGVTRPQETDVDTGAHEFVVPQYLRPDADVTDGTWTDQAGGTSLFAAIDEATASDADYIRSVLGPSNTVCEISLSSPASTPDTDEEHVVRTRYQKSDAGAPAHELRIRLLQGATQIATKTISNIPSAWTTDNWVLATTEVDDITDYTDLRIELRGNQSAGGGSPGTEPTYVGSGTGVEDTSGAYSASKSSCTAGNLILVVVNVDAATTDGTQTLGTMTNIEALDGTDSTITQGWSGSEPQIGSNASKLLFFLGRCIANGTCTFNATTAGQDVYVQVHEFANVNPAGTTVATVIENSTHGGYVNTTGNSTTVADADVTTLGANRLAVNIVGINDDNNVIAFTGESGGDWLLRANFIAAAGTDAAIGLQTASMPSTGTISGGTYTQVTDPWGTIGFAFKPSTPDSTDARTQVSWVEVEVPEPTGAATMKSGTDSGSGADSSSLTAVYPTTETGGGSDTPVLTAALGSTDTGSGSEEGGIGIPGSDSGAGVDSSSLAASYSPTEAGSGSDVGGLAVTLDFTEVGAGVETGTVSVPVTGTDAGTGVDNSVLTAAYAVTDAATGADVLSLAANYLVTETGTGTDSGSVVTDGGVTFINASDSGSGSDTGTMVAGVSGTDSGIGSENVLLTVVLAPVTESGVGSDASGLQAAYLLADAGVGADALNALAAALVGSDEGTAVEALLTQAIITASETGTAVEVGTVSFGEAIVGLRVEISEGGATITPISPTVTMNEIQGKVD